MSLHRFTLTEASRSADALEAARRNAGLVILTQRGKAPLAAIDLEVLRRLLRVANQVSQIVNEPGLSRLMEVTGLLSQSIAAMDGSPLEDPAWPARLLFEIEHTLGQPPARPTVDRARPFTGRTRTPFRWLIFPLNYRSSGR